jgi:hypothetical protein
VGSWLNFLIADFVAWRVTHLLANKDGPAGAIWRLRRRLGEERFPDGLLQICLIL